MLSFVHHVNAGILVYKARKIRVLILQELIVIEHYES